MRIVLFPLVILLVFAPALLAADPKAVCAVCGPREGAGPEPVKATATLKGNHYSFCSNECKIEFLKNPELFRSGLIDVPAPAIQLTALNGQPVDSDAMRGEVLVLDFWATWCAPCRAALPRLAELHSEYSSRGVRVVGLSTDEDAALVRRAMESGGVNYPVALATPAVWNAYRVSSLPMIILVDREGTVRGRFGGESTHEALLAALERELARR